MPTLPAVAPRTTEPQPVEPATIEPEALAPETTAPESAGAPSRAPLRPSAAAAARRRVARYRSGWAARPSAQAVLLLALSLAVRAPSFRRPFWSPDEGYLATEAAALRHGGRMYGDVVDRKPPLVPWLYEACSALAGPGSLWPVRVLAVVALAATAMFVARLAATELGRWAALPAGVLTVAASAALPAPDAMAATFEIFMLPATAAAMYFGARGRYFAAGLAVAVAGLTKQVGLAPLLPLAVQALASRHRLRQTAALAAGLLLPLLACASALGLRPFVFWVLLSSGSYAASPPGAMALGAHAAALLLRLGTVFVAFLPLLPRLYARRRSGGSIRSGASGRFGRSLWLWLLASAAGVSVGFHFYGHYFLQLVPPLALLATRALGDAFRRPQPGGMPPGRTPLARTALGRALARAGRTRAAAVAVGCAVAVSALHTGVALAAKPPEMDKSLAVARAVDAGSTPGQRVFLWGMHPEVYWLADRPAASRYLTAGLLTNFSGGGDVHRVGARYAVPGAWPAFRRELAAAPPCLVVDDSAGTPYPLADYPELRRLLSSGYTRVADVKGARIYRKAGC